MKKERIKNTILILLVISSLVLTCQIWLNEKLWPDGYNFFTNMQLLDKISGFFGVSENSEEQTRANIVSPAYLASYTVKDFDHAITVVNEANEHHNLIDEFVTTTITRSLSCEQKDITKVDETAWQRALFTRGFYIDYGIVYNTATFAELLNVKSGQLANQVSKVKHFIITADDSLISDISVYTEDEATNSFYKISTGLDKKQLSSAISLLSEQASAKKRFSFFINADVATGTAGEAVFAPYLILDEETSKHHDIVSVNPIVRDNAISSHTANKILRAFSINPKTVGKSTDADDNVTFVQSRATLKLSTNGSVTYTAAAGSKGLSLNPDAKSVQSTSRIITDAVRLMENISSSVLEFGETKLYMSDLIEGENSLTICFDYMHDGMPIVLGGNYGEDHAVIMEFENGHLKSYRQLIRRYEHSENMTLLPSTYDALNSIFITLTDEERQNPISDMRIAYYDNSDIGEKKPSWFLKLENTEKYINEIH